MNHARRNAVIMATATAIIWGLSFLSIKVAVPVLPPMSLGLARFIIASLVLLLWMGATRRRPRLALRDLPLMAGTGLVGVTLYFMAENNGVLVLTASESSIIVGTIPVVTALAERLFLRTRLGPAQYLGAALSAVGVGLMVAESLKLSANPLGYLYMAVAALSWVAYSFMTRPLLARYDNLEITLWQSVFGAAGFVPFALAETVRWEAVSPFVAGNVLFLGLMCSALGYLFYVASLKTLGAGVSSVFINLIPVVSVAASFMILGERLTALQLAGGAVAVFGVYLTVLAGGRPKAAADGAPAA